MENIRLQQRVEDLENALKRIKSGLESIQKIDNSHINQLTFQDGFKHATNLCKSIADLNIDAYLCP